MTRRRNPPPRRPTRSTKDKDQVDSDLRAARANRKAESTQKQKLRRLEWDEEAEGLVDEAEEEPEGLLFGEPGDEEQDEVEDEEQAGRG